MSYKVRSSLLSLAIIAVLVFSAFGPTAVYADDGTPPDTPPEANPACTADGECPSAEEVTEPTSGSAEVTAEATSIPEEVTPEPTTAAPEATAEPTSTPDEAPAEAGGEGTVSTEEVTDSQPSEEAAPVAEEASAAPDSSILDVVPEGTTVAVLDAEGQSQPLATQDAADAIATSDPIWCPQGEAPTPGANGCTASFTSFDDLLTFLSGNATFQGAGTIYIQQGAYNGGESIIDFNSAAYDLSNIRNSDLTVTGGWNTTNNTVDPASTSTFTIPIIIGTSTNPWGGSLSINNIVIRDVANPTNPTGLTLHSTDSINLSNVTVTNASNGSGAELNAGTVVTISDSKFERNKNAGASIKAGGNVAITNSSFSNPANARRQNTGLDIVSGGSVSLFSVLANENRKVGANIVAGGPVTIDTGVFSGTKDFTTSGGTTTFFGYGLQVITPAAITLDGVTANGNFLWGASLDNTKGTADVTIARSIFNGNTSSSTQFIDDTGLIVRSSGDVTLDTVQANDNPMIGADIQAAGLVTVANSEFSNNRGLQISNGVTTFFGYGLKIVAGNTISLFGVTASNNRLFGAHLEANSDVTVANSAFDNQSSGSATDLTGRGLEVISTGGIITLSNVSVSNNQLFGANLQAANNNIFLNLVTASNNGTDGVQVNALCTTLTGGTYSGNGQYGLNLGTSALNQSGAPIFSGNGAGDIFPTAPATCTVTTNLGNTGNANGGISTSASSFALQTASPNYVNTLGGGRSGVPSPVSQNVTLNSFLAHTRITSGGTELSIFVGQFAYIHSDSGVLYIIALSPSSHSLAMDGS